MNCGETQQQEIQTAAQRVEEQAFGQKVVCLNLRRAEKFRALPSQLSREESYLLFASGFFLALEYDANFHFLNRTQT